MKKRRRRRIRAVPRKKIRAVPLVWKNILNRTKYAASHTVRHPAIDDYYFANAYQYSRTPQLMSKIAATCLRAEIENKYHLKVKVEPYDTPKSD